MLKRLAQIGIASIVTLSIVSCASPKKSETAADGAKVSGAPQKDTKNSKKQMAASSTASSAEVKCTLNGDNRVLAITKNETGGCELNYTKNGETKSLANSAANASYCEEVQNRVKGNLVTAGFSCN
jgi:hypothetical protein